MRKTIAVLTIISGLMFIAVLGYYLQIISENAKIVWTEKTENTYGEISAETTKAATDEVSASVTENAAIKDGETYLETPKDANGESYLETPKDANGESLPETENTSGIALNNKDISQPPLSCIIKNVPLILQNPELPRGCEVTSLAMLMNFCGIKTDKISLSEKIKRDTTPRETKNNKIYWGNPNNGFIGDMYDFSKPGYGVYHKPIYELLLEYTPQAKDLTGCEFEEIKTSVANEIPVWVIINATYKPLYKTAFQTWHTPDGEIQITYREHSVLITGYDSEYVYFNDPLGARDKAEIEAFIQCWRQMGSQAVTVSM
ncbi:MAG: C39 family peptidase [Clostridiales bacterium]|jgi:uncharacterized protein YvpB|nr:C39 family peptidase [Clostridiales bacterium]